MPMSGLMPVSGALGRATSNQARNHPTHRVLHSQGRPTGTPNHSNPAVAPALIDRADRQRPPLLIYMKGTFEARTSRSCLGFRPPSPVSERVARRPNRNVTRVRCHRYVAVRIHGVCCGIAVATTEHAPMPLAPPADASAGGNDARLVTPTVNIAAAPCQSKLPASRGDCSTPTGSVGSRPTPSCPRMFAAQHDTLPDDSNAHE